MERRRIRDFDWVLALLATAIVVFGTWQIHNAQPTETFWQKQLFGLAIAIMIMFVIALIDYRTLIRYAPSFYILGLVLLIIVLFPGIGLKINGQRCWIKLPLIGQFQPSEFVKIPTVLM
ncbi:MAG: FtsW/RodA/SpoVE family cell cycle protein, partial [Pyrinomonadaceae bacterium]